MDVKVTIVFDNTSARANLKYGWGFAAVVDAGEARILFDTGPEGRALMYNLSMLHIDPRTVDAVFVSHDHWDHIGGLPAFLDASRGGLKVHLPAAASRMLQSRTRRHGGDPVVHGAYIEAPDEPPLGEIAPGVFTTGQMAATPPEHSMVLEIGDGPAIVTGCCHQGIVNLLAAVSERYRRPVPFALGGFHLFRSSRDQVSRVAMRARELGVGLLVATHCTGRKAAGILARELGEGCEKGGSGAVFQI